jgi:hypothetical protein
MSANFSDLQSVDTANGADQMMLRLNNGATGPDGFARIEITDLNSVFTSNLTASDAKVKELSAQWSAAYTEVNANSGVFALTIANSAQWDAAYDAVNDPNYNFGNKEFNYVVINGPNDGSSLGPVLKIRRATETAVDMVQVIPATNSTLFRITTAGQVGINIDETLTIAPDTFLYVNGNQTINSLEGNALTVNGNLFVNGSLSALSATYISTIVTNTSALSVTNNGIGPALFVRQTGIQPITLLRSDTATITFDNNGNITGFNDLSGSGRIIAGINNTAANATSYILGTSNSDNNLANVNILGSNITAPAANYTYVNNLSAPGIVAANTIAANTVTADGKTSLDWNNTYTLVNAQSASNASVYSSFNAQSASNASVYSSFNAQSASNANAYTTTAANSATWNALRTAFNVVSATNTSALTAIGLNDDINAALVAKGGGATLAQIPTNSGPGGNARGRYATDFQKERLNAIQVASGNYSVIGGGSENQATAIYSTVAGGRSNDADGSYSTAGGGYGNDASGDYTTIGGGSFNSTQGNFTTIGGGYFNNTSGEFAAIAGGTQNTASGISSTVVGGIYNVASGNYSTSIGKAAYATNYGELAVSSGHYSSYGDNKSSTFLLRRTTIIAGSAVAYLDGLTNTQEITLPPNSTYAYTATIVGLSSHSTSAGLHYILRGFAKCSDSTGSSVVTIYPATSDLTQRIPTTLNAGISAAGDKLRVVVYSPSNVFHYWTARIQAEYIQF